jgi:2-polyprenyl-3-methyl-5-hydroxy-6-metoxy-1,4-benzoquinol methylase
MSSLALRSREEEQMDSAALGAAEYEKVLRDLSLVNRWTFAARPTLDFVRRSTKGSSTLRLLDVGFGSGDMLRTISGWAARRGLRTELVGIDLNPKSAPVAEALTPANANIEYRTGDYRALDGRFDVIVSSLVAHHMSEPELIDFIRFMEARSDKGWIINDLHRHRFAYSGYPLLAAMLRVHSIVRADGRLSIARAFRPTEWKEILQQAGVRGARIVRRFPFRLCVERLR